MKLATTRVNKVQSHDPVYSHNDISKQKENTMIQEQKIELIISTITSSPTTGNVGLLVNNTTLSYILTILDTC
jgi:hypothetical protein